MNFDKESKSVFFFFFFFFFLGGGMRWGDGGAAGEWCGHVLKPIMAESKKGHNFAILGLTKKKRNGFAYFFVLML